MPDLLKKIFFSLSKRMWFYTFILGGLVVYHVILFQNPHKVIKGYKKIISHQVIGHKVLGLDQFTQGIDYIGFYTDWPDEDKLLAEFFAQAQYVLAPSLLDYKNTDHKYLLLYCSSEPLAWAKMKQVNASPLRKNKHGVIFAEKLE